MSSYNVIFWPFLERRELVPNEIQAIPPSEDEPLSAQNVRKSDGIEQKFLESYTKLAQIRKLRDQFSLIRMRSVHSIRPKYYTGILSAKRTTPL